MAKESFASRRSAAWTCGSKKGELLAIMGPSGSGKSTLLHLLGGVDTPTSGQVFLEQVNLATLSDDTAHHHAPAADRVHFPVVQSPADAHGRGKCLAVAGTGWHVNEGGPSSCRWHALELVGMARRKTHLPSMLSGGEQQRVAIARALVIDPAIVLADEPTGNLDSANGRQITALLRRMCSNRRQTIAMVTHDPNVAAQADRLVCLRDGLVESDNGQVPVGTAGNWSRRGVAAMIFWELTGRELRRRPGRALLTLLSIAIGMAAVVSVSLGTATTRQASQQMVETITGRTALEITAEGGGDFPETVVSTVERVPASKPLSPAFSGSPRYVSSTSRSRCWRWGSIRPLTARHGITSSERARSSRMEAGSCWRTVLPRQSALTWATK